MPALITTKTGDRILVDESSSTITKEIIELDGYGARPNLKIMLLELTLYRSTPRRKVYLDAFSVESIREDN